MCLLPLTSPLVFSHSPSYPLSKKQKIKSFVKMGVGGWGWGAERGLNQNLSMKSMISESQFKLLWNSVTLFPFTAVNNSE